MSRSQDKRMKQILLMTLLFASVTTYAHAEWKSIGQGSTDVSYYYDTKRITKSRKTVKLWTRVAKDGVTSPPSHMEINCADSTYRLLDTKDDWGRIAPRTMIDILKNKLCK